MKASSAPSTFGQIPSSAWVASAASRMPESKRLKNLSEDGDVGVLFFAPEGDERGVVRLAAAQRDLGCGSGGWRGGRGAEGGGGSAGAFFGRHRHRDVWGDNEGTGCVWMRRSFKPPPNLPSLAACNVT
eukprot:scaffold24263_cov69-Phaeocystis_antarctica.AAC.10